MFCFNVIKSLGRYKKNCCVIKYCSFVRLVFFQRGLIVLLGLNFVEIIRKEHYAKFIY